VTKKSIENGSLLPLQVVIYRRSKKDVLFDLILEFKESIDSHGDKHLVPYALVLHTWINYMCPFCVYLSILTILKGSKNVVSTEWIVAEGT
jgi:hypothetical protein